MPNVSPLPTVNPSGGLDRLATCIDAAREMEPAFPVQWLAAVLHVARNEDKPDGLSVRDLADLLGTSYTTVAEAVKKMAVPSRRFSEASDLLKYEMDPMDNRRKLIRLTSRGRSFVRRLEMLNACPPKGHPQRKET